MLLRFILLIFFFKSFCAEEQERYVAHAHMSFKAFHAMAVLADIVPSNGDVWLMDDPNRDLLVNVSMNDRSRRTVVSSHVRIEVWEDMQWPRLPEKWEKRFEKTVSYRGQSYLAGSAEEEASEIVRIPGSLFRTVHPMHRIRLRLSVRGDISDGWIGREDIKESVFFTSPMPRLEGRLIHTASVPRLTRWAYARARVLEQARELFARMMDPTYRYSERQNVALDSMQWLRDVHTYLNRYHWEVNFKPWMAEFVTSYAKGLAEPVQFPVEFGSFLNVPDPDFSFKELMPSLVGMAKGYNVNPENQNDFLALTRIVGLELRLLERIHEVSESVHRGIELMSSLQNLPSREDYVKQVTLIQKNEEEKHRRFESLGMDMKRILGWDNDNGRWIPLNRSPFFELANSEIYKTGRREFIEATVIEAVRGLYWGLFFILASEDHYSKTFMELAETALGVFQLSPPQITFQLDREILFNGEPGVLIARVFNPSRYLALKNIHLLVEKQNLQHTLFFRGDNLQTVAHLEPQAAKHVFFRFTGIGVGTDHPRLRVRYNQDHQTLAQAIPVTITRKDAFLAQAQEKAQDAIGRDAAGSFSRLREKLEGLADRIEEERMRQTQNQPLPQPQEIKMPIARPGRGLLR